MNKKNIKPLNNGSVLPLVLFSLLLLSIMGLGLLTLAFHSRMRAVRTVSEIAARSAADAGIIKAIFEMNKKLLTKPWSENSLPSAEEFVLPNSDAKCSYTVTNNSGIYSVSVTGRYGRIQKTVSCMLGLSGPFDYAIFGRDAITLKNSSRVDWYNNDANDATMKVGTNSTISDTVTLNHDSYINGDVVIGEDGNPSVVIKDLGAIITGDSYAMTESQNLPMAVVPPTLASLPSSGNMTNNTTLSTSAKYTTINLGNSKQLTINGPVELYVTGNISLGNSASIRINNAPNCYLKLYSGGTITGNNGSNINNLTLDATRLTMYGLDACTSIELKNSATFYGTIYAPEASIVFYNSAAIYGAIVGKSFEQKNSANINYDANLRNVNPNDQAVKFVIARWTEGLKHPISNPSINSGQVVQYSTSTT